MVGSRHRSRSRAAATLVALITSLMAALLHQPSSAQSDPPPSSPPSVPADLLLDARPVGGQGRSYVVQVAGGVRIARVLRRAAVPGRATSRLHGPAFRGAVVRLTPAQARRLARLPGVRGVEPDRAIGITATDGSAASWGLDRVDQPRLPLDGRFWPVSDGADVHVFLIDSGIDTDHPEFAGRIGRGASTVGNTVEDCSGHGTHVAGTVGSARFGMARQAILHPVRVLDCAGVGSRSTMLAALNWVAESAPPRSVVNLSVGGPSSATVDEAVTRLVARGLVVVAAAGNDGADACDFSPAGVPGAVTVGATDRSDAVAPYSRTGPCVDLFAPGSDIVSTARSADRGSIMSGTSMAAPHVSGAAAQYWALHPQATDAEVVAALLNLTATDVLTFPAGSGGAPNRLVNVGWPAPPAAPELLVAVPGHGSVVLRWRRPLFDGHSLVTGYDVQLRQPGRAWLPVEVAPHTGRRASVTGLQNGRSYVFRVAAVNAYGTGPFITSARVVPPGLPGRPGRPTIAVRSQTTVKLVWRPAAAATSDVRYLVQMRAARRPWHTVARTSALRWSGVLPTGRRFFRVVPATAAGRGLPSGVTSVRLRS